MEKKEKVSVEGVAIIEKLDKENQSRKKKVLLFQQSHLLK